jgi:hypothetical protein
MRPMISITIPTTVVLFESVAATVLTSSPYVSSFRFKFSLPNRKDNSTVRTFKRT